MRNKKVWKVNFYKYTLLIICILLLIPYDIYQPDQELASTNRYGYFANRVQTKSISISGVTEIDVKTKNWIVYILENTDSTSLIDLYVPSKSLPPLPAGSDFFATPSWKFFNV